MRDQNNQTILTTAVGICTCQANQKYYVSCYTGRPESRQPHFKSKRALNYWAKINRISIYDPGNILKSISPTRIKEKGKLHVRRS